ncbi:uncharacterized protein JCM6883_004759 [Sporobolomyces salmoneus]|uniref:uncharacterized protein n=1 Tax=Sporobolomyces salmoneus TaxID=183962 RepID=UPI00316B628C
MPPIGTIVYDGVKPLIRVFITTAVGFILIKRNIIPREGTNVFSHLIVNATLPCLLFSKIVPSFTSDNIGALGPIFLVGCVYQLLSGLLGLIARSFTPTPRRFRYGMVSSYLFSNWGDLPIGVISSIMTSEPFNRDTDEALGIAYVAIFILINYISRKSNGLRLVAMDYTREISAEDERRSEDGEYGTFQKYLNRLIRGMPMAHELEETRRVHFSDDEKPKPRADVDSATNPSSPSATSTVFEREPTLPATETITSTDVKSSKGSTSGDSRHATPQPLSRRERFLGALKSGIKHTLKPPTISLICSIIIGVIPFLRNLFVPAESGNSKFSPLAPDGNPPLSTIYDACSFIGAASVPLGLIVLGASIATIQIPRPITRLPIASMLAMALVKLAVLPIFGFFFVKALVKSGIVDSENKVLIFVLTSLSCVPTGTIQVVWSRLLAPPGVENNATLLGAYLLPQYFIWAISSVLLTAFTLNTLF